MHQASFKLIACILLISVLPSASFYIQIYESINNETLKNGQEYRVFYQPAFCKTREETCDPQQKFNVEVQVQHLCVPNQTLSLTIPCPIACSSPKQYINCTNLFTGSNQNKQFTALVTMNSTINSSHNVAVNYTINVTWINSTPVPPPPPPGPTPDNTTTVSWPMYVGIAVGVVALVGIAIFIVRKIRSRKNQGYSQMTS